MNHKPLTLPELVKLHDQKVKERDEYREKANLLNKEIRELKNLITDNLTDMVVTNDTERKIDPNSAGWTMTEIKY